MPYDKQTFLRNVTVLVDTRERENRHILRELDHLEIAHKDRKMDFGDYSFEIAERDFSLSCVIERKADVDELYGNLTKDRDRIEKEFSAANSIAKEFVLLIETCRDIDDMRRYRISDFDMIRQHRKIQNIGEYCYSTLKSWECGNRYKFRTRFVSDRSKTAAAILEEFYWYWRNYKIMTRSRRTR